MYIIIADDNDQDRYLLKVLLENQGYQVAALENGRQVLDAANARRPDLIITDILMPVMDGFMLLDTIRHDEHLHDVPFIIYTATYVEDEDEALAFRLGADRVMHKPIILDHIVQVVQEIFAEQLRGDTQRRRKLTLSEHEYYVLYNQRLLAKLEDKLVQVDHANQLLRERGEELQRSEAEYVRLLREAQGALRQRDAYRAAVAGELRSSLLVLKVSLQTVQRNITEQTEGVTSNLTQEQRNLADAIERIRRMERLVEEIAAAATTSVEELELAFRPVSLGVLLQQQVVDQSTLAAQHEIQLDFVQQDALELEIEADEAKLQQALANVLATAIRLSPAGSEVRITASQNTVLHQAIITIHAGAPDGAETQPSGRFQNYRTNEFEGKEELLHRFNPGLQSTKAVIEAHHGQWIVTEAQGRNTFTIRLPLSGALA